MIYTYRFHNRYSTKRSEIRDEHDQVTGYVQRTYANPLMKVLDFLLEGIVFADYRVTDRAGNLRVEAKQVRTFFKRRQYILHYEQEDGTRTSIPIIDKKRFGLEEKTGFELEGRSYELHKPVIDWGTITLQGTTIAEWKSSLTLPPKAQFRLADPSHEAHVLLLLGIFHTYLHSK
ncbi:tubby C-terminal domain-like protein [Paenibacillus tarimensis]|uniref:tubby C-terminal domain-like protein n=1 Tax=Paenibacillus tarimensis TaxID=416012 RepID=UPI001F3D196B|nr:hypothetical protein [Paenibacillus tarimensis]MCF2943314.1 hypothetical protein [Paenibacillus tarimensis]